MQTNDLKSLTVPELKQLAKTTNVKLNSKMLKADIIAALMLAPPMPAPVTAKEGRKGEY